MREGDLFDDLPDPAASARREHPEGASAPPPEELPAAGPAELFENAQVREVPPGPQDEPAPAPAPRPAPEPEPEPEHTELPRAATVGQTLTELRRRRKLTLDEVADETRIKKFYIEALERDAVSDVPHMVYVLAYVRKLCALYGVSPADTEEMLSGLRRNFSYEIPEDIDKSVICREVDEDTRRKLRQISIGIVVGIALIVLLLVLGGTVLILRAHRAQTIRNGRTATLNAEWLERNLKPQELSVSTVERRR